jgi:hypothetical protein
VIGTLTVVDDVLPRDYFLAWRDMARRLDFQTVQHPRDGHEYRNVGLLPSGWSMAETLAQAMGVGSIQMVLEFLRLGEPHDGAGNIHCDDGDGAWASVYYLNTNEELKAFPSGTAFWEHRWLGKDFLPPGIEPDVVALVNADRMNEAAWEPLYQIPAKENRLIIYPTHLFHSRWPLEPAAGRLVHVGFFNV